MNEEFASLKHDCWEYECSDCGRPFYSVEPLFHHTVGPCCSGELDEGEDR